MAEYKMKCSRLTTVGSPTVNNKKLTNASAICSNKTTAYILKTAGKTADKTPYPIALYKVDNFNTKPKLTLINVTKNNKPYINCYHANDITYADGYLYIATMNDSNLSQLIKVSTNGKVKKEYLYNKGGTLRSFSCVAYIGKINGHLSFIIGRGKTDNHPHYELVHIENNELIFDKSYIAQEIPSDYTANAIHYNTETKRLYTTFFQRNSAGLITINHIYRYNLSALDTGYNLTPINHFLITKPKEYDKKFEVEAVTTIENKKFILCNCESTKGGDFNKDGLFKIAKQ